MMQWKLLELEFCMVSSPAVNPLIYLCNKRDIVTLCMTARIVMATGSPMVNGDVPHAASPPGTLEETLQLMNNLIQENRDLKGENQGRKLSRGAEKIINAILKKKCYLVLEALRQTNLSMKERFEGLSAWREKQQEERNFLESKLADARKHIETLTLQNQELSRKTGKDGNAAAGGSMVRPKPFPSVCTKAHRS